MIKERIEALRSLMRSKHIDAYYIPSDDFHSSENVCRHFQCRQYISGFTGSACSVIITQQDAVLWTDGRYFIQAEQQLADTGIRLFRSGQIEVPTILQYLQNTLINEQVLGFDGRTVNAEFTEKLQQFGIKFDANLDLVGEIWKDRPPLPCKKVYILHNNYTGKSAKHKLYELRKKCTTYNADVYLTTSLDEIAWLLNLRGGDIEYNPVFLAYCIIEKDTVQLFANQKCFSVEVQNYLRQLRIQLNEYNEIYTYLRSLHDKTIIIDKSAANHTIITAAQKNTLLNDNFIQNSKAIKNEVEIENEKIAHIKDGIAITEFIYWLKTTTNEVTELSAAKKLEEFRNKQNHYLGQSFYPIIAYGKHGAIIHYAATTESNTILNHDNFVLIDTGGHYYEGTTDITRTIILGTASAEQKKHYTSVLKANIALSRAIFREGYKGFELDCLARENLWKLGLDYNHGTGHGVGYLLNVHEEPISFSKRKGGCVFKPGMIASNEPGLYLENKYGIRLENLMFCKKYKNTEFGHFLCFEILTLCPFDLDAIDPTMLNNQEKDFLNRYHKKVLHTLSPFVHKKTAAWLQHATQEIL